MSRLARHVSFMRHLKKYADCINIKICGGNMRKSGELYILWSELSRRKLSPTLSRVHYSCPDNAIRLVGWQLEAVRRKFSGYYQCLCRSNVMHNPRKLNTDSNRNTKNIKIIKTAVENANLCGKSMRCVHFAEICEKCGNMRNMRQSHIRVKVTCLTGPAVAATPVRGVASQCIGLSVAIGVQDIGNH